MQFISTVENLAQQVAQLGHALRIEEYENVNKVKDYAQDLYNIADELAELDEQEMLASILKCTQAMMDAYNAMNAVALADVLEYELLHECEKIIDLLKNE